MSHYKRILLKISGEAFCEPGVGGLESKHIENVAQIIKEVVSQGLELVIVVGGGNIYRGSDLIKAGMKSSDSHNMSMLSTVFNGLSLKNFLEKQGIEAIVLDALGVEFLVRYTSLQASEYLKSGKIVICTSGTGSPYVSTDTAGVVRSIELECDIMIKATKVDGVYESDPIKNSDAKKIESISYDEFIGKNLQVFDQTGIILARDNKLEIVVTKFDKLSILEILNGDKTGTSICSSEN
ncbi:uridine monophosphate kinase [Candidatus Gracilibacteria bacterium]|nr:uridine monophosphate kinase [Candidatus Gracilibacteria bacterium]